MIRESGGQEYPIGRDKKTLDLLQAYDWSGNIREAQNVIERFVFLSSGNAFSVDQLWLSKETSRPAARVEASAGFTSEGEPRSERENYRGKASNSTIYPRDPDQGLEHR